VISESILGQGLVAYDIGFLSPCIGLNFVFLVQLFNLVVLIEVVVENIVQFVLSILIVAIDFIYFIAPLVIDFNHRIFHQLVIAKNLSFLPDLLNTLIILTHLGKFHLYKLVALNQVLLDFFVELKELR
jgi:hypothetical protein